RLASLDDLLGLSGYASSTATIRLDSFASPHLWDLLAQASDLGIPLVSTDKQIAVRLADAASFHIDVTRSDPAEVSDPVEVSAPTGVQADRGATEPQPDDSGAGSQAPLWVAPEVMIDGRP